MQLISVVSVMALVPAVFSYSVTGRLVARDDDRGNQTVAGLGSRKQAVLDVGGTTRDLAIAMLETSVDSHMLCTYRATN
jgi:hypothetical protein